MKILFRGVKLPWEKVDPLKSVIDNDWLGNTGNMLFHDAAIRSVFIDEDTTFKFSGSVIDDSEIEQINSEYDYYIIPFADAFRESFIQKLDNFTRNVKILKIPCVMLSGGFNEAMGVHFTNNPIFPQDEAVKRFCSAILDKCVSIGVRGETTRDYLVKHLGFPSGSVDVIGCPSMHLFSKTNEALHKEHINDVPQKIATNFRPENLGKDSEAGYIKLKKLILGVWNEYPQSYYYPQLLSEARLWAFGYPCNIKQQDYPVSLTHMLSIENRIRFCTNTFTWIDSLREMDFSIGIRLHGTIAAVLAGIPSLLVTSDSRSVEVAKYHNIPSVSVDEITESMRVEDLFERAVQGMPDLARIKEQNYNDYVSYLNRNGIKNIFSNSDGNTPVFDDMVRDTKFPKPIESFSAVSVSEQEARLTYYYRNLGTQINEQKKQIKKQTVQIEKFDTHKYDYMEHIEFQLRANNIKYVAIYGSGKTACRLIEGLSSVKVCFIIESDEKKWGERLNGIPIVSLEEAVNQNCRNIIIGSINFKEEIIKRMHKQRDVNKENIRIFNI